MFNATNGGGRSYVTRADTARTAAGALLSAEGQAVYDVTGPAPVTQVELAGLISDLSGKPLAAIGLTAAQLSEGLTAAGLRSEEHTSELQSRLVSSYAVFCLKKKITPSARNF